MIERRAIPTVAVAFIASVVLHGLVLLPWLMGVMSADARPHDRLSSALDPAASPERIDLGVEAKTPSSLTWIGYEEYEEHLAALSEVEQAQFTTEAPGGAFAMVAEPLREPIEPIEPAEFDRPQPERVQPDLPQAAETRFDPPTEIPVDLLPSDVDPLALIPESDEWQLADFFGPKLVEPEEVDAPTADAPADAPESGAAAPAPPPAPPAEPAPPAKEPAETSGEETSELPGDVSEKESDAASVVEAPPDAWKLGKPLAAHGLELKPRRPSFTLLVRLLASPGNPQTVMHFDRRGLVVRARIVKSSGDSRIDSAILSSLYGWTATGERLKDLGPEETIEVPMRLILVSE